MITKRIALVFSGVISLAFLVLDLIGTYKLFGKYSVGNCPLIIHNIIIELLPFVAVFILSLITYKMRDQVFHSWLKFAYFWVLLTIILTILAPEYDSSFVSLTKGLVSFTLSAIFLLISLIIIIIKSFSSKKGQ